MMLLAGCASVATTSSAPTVSVTASAETQPVGSSATVDAADDPAIFAPADGQPFRFAGQDVGGVILGTDKKAGLYVYDLQGKSLQFLPDGLLNNVDMRVEADGQGFIAGASDRGRMGVSLYRFSKTRSSSDRLEPAGFIKSDVVEPYGFCMGRRGDTIIAVLVAKDGAVRQYALAQGADGQYTGTEERRFAVGTQSEGCVVDDKAGTLYIGEEMKGVWRYAIDPASADARVLVQGLGDGRLVADVEGTTIIEDGGARYLIVSSQGDSAFAVWRVDGAEPAYVGRFRVVDTAGGVDGISGTDGLDAHGGPVPGYPAGLLVIQDDQNIDANKVAGPQNFKLVDWAAVRLALGIAN